MGADHEVNAPKISLDNGWAVLVGPNKKNYLTDFFKNDLTEYSTDCLPARPPIHPPTHLPDALTLA